MSVIDELSSSLDRRDEVPNIELADKIAVSEDEEFVAQIVENLSSKKKQMCHDCIKVLYEIAERKPKLVSPFVNIFIDQLKSTDNRMVWGAMTALDAISGEKLNDLFARITELKTAVEIGSVITRDHFVSIIAKLVAAGDRKLLELFSKQLRTCPSNQLPMNAERHFEIVEKDKSKEFQAILSARLGELKTDAKRKRVEKVIRKFL